VLILDEPSAVLTPQETDELFEVMRSLVAGGTSIVFITHKLNEVLEVADRITVLRRGTVAGTTTPAETSLEELAAMMVGRDVQLVVDRPPVKPGEPVLEVRDLVVRDERGHNAVNHLDLAVRAGEILAIAGVQGNGQSELVEAITGLREPDAGDVLLAGRPLADTPRGVFEDGVAHVPEDRMEDGLIGEFTVADNLVLNSYWQPPFAKGLRLDGDAIVSNAETLVDEYDIRTPSIFNPVGNLSGGNQQKVVVAREFERDLKLLVLDQPTRGLDVGSIEFIHRQAIAKRDARTAILLVSAELDEVLELSDRVAVMFRGRIVATLDGRTADKNEVGLLMATGGQSGIQPVTIDEGAA